MLTLGALELYNLTEGRCVVAVVAMLQISPVFQHALHPLLEGKRMEWSAFG